MPVLPGLFDSFDNLDYIRTEDIAKWLKPTPPLTYIENYVAQRILFPQTIPITKSDMDIELAILREAVRSSVQLNRKNAMLGDNPFINLTLRKLLIPAKMLNFVKDLPTLVWVFVDALLLGRNKKDHFEDLWTIVLTGESDETIGSILLPKFSAANGQLQLGVLDRVYKIAAGGLVVIPCNRERCKVTMKLKFGKILGKSDPSLEVYGGRLGLVVDGRGL